MRRLDFPEKKLLGSMSDATVKARRQGLEDWVNALLSARLDTVPVLLRARADVVVWLNSERGARREVRYESLNVTSDPNDGPGALADVLGMLPNAISAEYMRSSGGGPLKAGWLSVESGTIKVSAPRAEF